MRFNAHTQCSMIATALTWLWLTAGGSAHAQLPASGVPVPELSVFDNVMQAYMDGNGINAGVLAVSVDGVVVYQRGFGVGIPENMPMRIASVEKPIVAAAAVKLMNEGVLNMNDTVFNVNGSGGILPHQPYDGRFASETTDWLASITVGDLLNHQGGWDRCLPFGDPQFQTLGIANALGIDPPADRDDIISFMLSRPVDFQPGTNMCTPDPDINCCYSNFGYMVLGRVIEEVTGMGLIDYIRAEVLTPAIWVPNQEIVLGRTFYDDQDPREPTYQCSGCDCTNVFDPRGETVPCPYGGWHHEAFLGHGNLVTSVGPLLAYMNNYQIGVGGAAGATLPSGSFGNAGNHAGRVDGTSTMAWQRGDGVNCVVFFTRGDADYAVEISSLIDDIIDTQNFDWPTMAVDGFWVDFNASSDPIEVGGFHHPFQTMEQALNVGSGAKVRLKPGSSNWTGVIDHPVRLDAPFGVATIGQ